MKNKPQRWVVFAVAVLFCLGIISQGEGQVPNDVKTFMQLKLTHSQKVLEGLVMEDFEKVSKHSQQLSLLSQEASWRVLQTPEYLEHSVDFRQAAAALHKAAKAKNLDGTALAYVQLTMNCVDCHKYVRGAKLAKIGLPTEKKEAKKDGN